MSKKVHPSETFVWKSVEQESGYWALVARCRWCIPGYDVYCSHHTPPWEKEEA